MGAASQVNVSSANAQESIVNVLDTIDRSVNSSISGDSALVCISDHRRQKLLDMRRDEDDGMNKCGEGRVDE